MEVFKYTNLNDCALSVYSLYKKIHRKQILSDINFRVGYGEIVGLVGSNGAGKTSIMKCITGLWRYKEGKIHIYGENLVENFTNCMQNTAAIVDYPKLFGNMTLLQNIEYISCYYPGVNKGKIDELLIHFNLKEFEQMKIKTFSSGMHQKACLLIVLLRKPKLLILDEPTSLLDPKSASEIRDLITYLKSKEVSMLISSHNLNELEKICDRAVIIDNGKVINVLNLNDRSISATYILEFDSAQSALELFKQAQHGFSITIKDNKIYLLADTEQFQNFIIKHQPKFINLYVKDKLEQAFLTSIGEQKQCL